MVTVTDSATATTGEATKTHRVLVAEDDSLIRMDLIEMLREEGYDVVGEAPNGQVAVEPVSYTHLTLPTNREV